MRIKQVFIVLIALILISFSLLSCRKKEASTTFQEQYDLGIRYLSEGKYEEAILVFNSLIKIDPKNLDAYIGLADAYIGIGDYKAAIAALELCIINIGKNEIIDVKLNQIQSMKDNNSTDLSYMIYNEGDLAGYIRPEIIDELTYTALSTAKISRVNDKFYINITLPELPEEYLWDVTASITELTAYYGTEINGHSNFLGPGKNTCPIDVVGPLESEREGDIMVSLSIYVVNLAHRNTNDRMGGFRGDYVYSLVYKYLDKSEINYQGEGGLFKQFYCSHDGNYDYYETVEYDASHIWQDVLDYFEMIYGTYRGNSDLDEPSIRTFADSAGDYLGLSVKNVTELIGKNYEVVNSWNSTGFYYDDISIFFLIGELFPEGHKLTGEETVKFIEVYDGQVVPGVHVGDSAKIIVSTLNLTNSTLEFDEAAESEGHPPYVLYYETELNGYKSFVWFYFNSPDGVCEYAFIKSDELYGTQSSYEYRVFLKMSLIVFSFKVT